LNLSRMIFAAAIVGFIGWQSRLRLDDRRWLLGIGIVLMVAFVQGGMYWNVFGHGEGPPFFTYNRLSAMVILTVCLIAPTLTQRR
jgi:hypothetical protein